MKSKTKTQYCESCNEPFLKYVIHRCRLRNNLEPQDIIASDSLLHLMEEIQSNERYDIQSNEKYDMSLYCRDLCDTIISNIKTAIKKDIEEQIDQHMDSWHRSDYE